MTDTERIAALERRVERLEEALKAAVEKAKNDLIMNTPARGRSANWQIP